MSNQSSGALTLKDILLGITDSLSDAQHKLRNMAPYDEYGRPNTMYQIPYLDFNLQVTSEFESASQNAIPQQESIGEYTSAVAFQHMSDSKPKMMFRPVQSQGSSNEVSSEVVSTISGRFVATMPNDGIPQVILNCTYKDPLLQNGVYIVDLDVMIENAAGEKLSGMKVEFNFDEDKTNMLNGMPLVQTPTFNSQELYTDGLGMISNKIIINAVDYTSGKILFFDVNTGTITKKISISKL